MLGLLPTLRNESSRSPWDVLILKMWVLSLISWVSLECVLSVDHSRKYWDLGTLSSPTPNCPFPRQARGRVISRDQDFCRERSSSWGPCPTSLKAALSSLTVSSLSPLDSHCRNCPFHCHLHGQFSKHLS